MGIPTALVAVDGENITSMLMENAYTLHEIIAYYAGDYRVIHGPAFFITVGDKEFESRNEEGALRHQLLGEVTVPMAYPWRKDGELGLRGYEDTEIIDYVTARLNDFDALFIFSGDHHFAEFVERCRDEYGKEVFLCGDPMKTSLEVQMKDYYRNILDHFRQKKPAPSTNPTPKVQSTGDPRIHVQYNVFKAPTIINWNEFDERAKEILAERYGH